MIEEKFDFTASLKKKLLITGLVGVVLFVVGVIAVMMGGGHEEAAHGAAAAGHAAEGAGHGAGGEHGGSWITRVYANLWINNVYFAGVALIGVFFVAVQYVAQAGWSAPIKRIPLAFGNWLPIAGILMLVIWLVAGHDLFHWTHEDLYVEGGPHYDAIIAGKKAYLNTPFYLARMVIYFTLWFLFFRWIRKEMLAEDLEGSTQHWRKLVGISAGFIVVFAVTSSMAAWDWILSIDTHWFSTMIGWYVFASWFVTGLAAITLITVYLKEGGYLSIVNSNHLHDLGKFVFAFSIFWAYIWVSQYLLIYYANIPEESVYFMERLNSDQYAPVFYVVLIMNFFFPFLALMTRDAKRQVMFLKIVCPVVMIGHWLDFYLMVTPGTLKESGGFGFLEIGMAIIFAVTFLFVILNSLSKVPLVAKNHPMLEESMHHHI
ncbi:MAG: quinol:cytochrome C oxidoreductase [Cyclobacteriaceae bacterium]|nr:MAG: quinol:cytochrome C oxidoreductase [Cyclobacteriaceae bacterium]